MATQIVPFKSDNLPAFLKQGSVAVSNELAANVGGGGYPVFSIKGKVFALVRSGERETLMNPNDPDEVATSINVVILKANPNLSKVFYSSGYTEGSDAKPDCFSNDGTAPDPSVEHPQAKKCAVCPKNQWGSRISENGSKGKACADSRRLAVANPDNIEDPILLRAPAATLKPLAEYGSALAKKGIPYNAVVTKVGFDPEAASPKLTFKPIGFLTEEQFAQVHAVLEEPVVESILGKPGEAVAEGEADDGIELPEGTPPKLAAPAPKAEEPKPAAKPAAKKAEPKAKPAPKAEKAAVVSEDEVDAAFEEAPAPAPKEAKKAEPKIVDDALEDDLDALLDELDD